MNKRILILKACNSSDEPHECNGICEQAELYGIEHVCECVRDNNDYPACAGIYPVSSYSFTGGFPVPPSGPGPPRPSVLEIKGVRRTDRM